MKQIYQQIATEMEFEEKYVAACIAMIEDGNTIPFIARYRKERTGELDEEQLRAIDDRYQYMVQLHQRKQEVLRLIEEQGKLSDDLRRHIEQAQKLQEVEDLYRPYKQKRKTRASKAKERGLEPLAEFLLKTTEAEAGEVEAQQYVNEEQEVATVEDALAGAMDIIAERISDDAKIRQWLRTHTWDVGVLSSTAKDKELESVYEMYYDWHEPIKKAPPHRILAVNRGEREDFLRVKAVVEEEEIFRHIAKLFFNQQFPHRYLQEALEDGYKRLLAPAIEREIRAALTEKAETQAIHIFSENLRKLLLQPPIRGKWVLALDPAYRTGCKWAVVDPTGKVMEYGVIYPTKPHARVDEAKRRMKECIAKWNVDLFAIGNGTASRETEQFVADLFPEVDRPLHYVMVNEAGASVYSASKRAREEFPDLDVAERSAISIARRLQDPLAELVKIDPKAIGVGQYQHDVSQKQLEQSLTTVVESAVNHVGVDVNTASSALLQYVAGISASVANNIVRMREEEGSFSNRKELKKVPRLGAKTYEQCIGFLRIMDGEDARDKTPIHPESYTIVQALLTIWGMNIADIGTPAFQQKVRAADPHRLAEELECGLPTMRDILEALIRPGRDPRDQMPAPILRSDVLQLEDLTQGLKLKGTVRNVVDFGAFVDIGLKNDGLVHISKLSDRFVRHPLDVVAVGDIVDVWVLEVDEERQRVGLAMIPVENEREKGR
ncbi:Tex family protein [Mechercharimyces sp. CAU 1602]|uniref:Tex family protein n=1 Tax=Mechercharimyces sp. CAU 1602 TaxID=2973933 RepID=UPI002162BCA0|nr:Tex family protein [Mechercharimyces sp. CAU 1602]MCS1352134.1 RNA-binding transcriptional accessory protein [Mechercharimyces sp. CAU 1602]